MTRSPRAWGHTARCPAKRQAPEATHDGMRQRFHATPLCAGCPSGGHGCCGTHAALQALGQRALRQADGHAPEHAGKEQEEQHTDRKRLGAGPCVASEQKGTRGTSLVDFAREKDELCRLSEPRLLIEGILYDQAQIPETSLDFTGADALGCRHPFCSPTPWRHHLVACYSDPVSCAPHGVLWEG